jgi:lipoyl(octanoyl) transferase
MTISVIQLGRVDYATGLRIQQQLVERRKAGQIGDVLVLLEHTPVITLGRNAKASNVLASPEHLSQRGVEVFECDRGGDVTFHGPGQLVGYPIFDLRGFGKSSQLSALSSQESSVPSTHTTCEEEEPETVATSWLNRRGTLGAVDYVRRLEEVLIRTCAEFGIAAERVSGLTGVWTARGPSTSQAKIAAIGVHISRGVTSHGFALNVNTDLSYFDLIVPCGITAKPVTSMQKELLQQIEFTSVAESVARTSGDVFGRPIVWVDTLDALVGDTVGIPMRPPRELRELRGEEESFLA